MTVVKKTTVVLVILLLLCCLQGNAQSDPEPFTEASPTVKHRAPMKDMLRLTLYLSTATGGVYGFMTGFIIVICKPIPFTTQEAQFDAAFMVALYMSFWGTGIGYLIGEKLGEKIGEKIGEK